MCHIYLYSEVSSSEQVIEQGQEKWGGDAALCITPCINRVATQFCEHWSLVSRLVLCAWLGLKESTNPDSELPMVGVQKRSLLSSPFHLSLAPLQFEISGTRYCGTSGCRL